MNCRPKSRIKRESRKEIDPKKGNRPAKQVGESDVLAPLGVLLRLAIVHFNVEVDEHVEEEENGQHQLHDVILALDFADACTAAADVSKTGDHR